MNGDKLKLWIDALRSGDYGQTKAQLQDRDGKFCCLGVLCEVAVKDGVKLDVQPFDYGDYARSQGIAYDGYATFPPPAVWQWLESDLGAVYVPVPESLQEHYALSEEISVVSLNDREGWNFNQIADVVEARYLPQAAA